jgi:acetyltransferase-like isoleucine patch superfamily enzyme
MGDGLTARLRRSLEFRVRRRLLGVLHQPAPIDERLERLITVGRHTYPARPTVLEFQTYSTRLDIGAFCSIASEVLFCLDAEHHTEWVTTFPVRIQMSLPGEGADGHPFSKGDITVGNDVWIGTGATILSGVTIGDGAVVGAGSVVASDIPPYGIVVGNPARLIRTRFSEAQIAALLRIAWWQWPDDVIEERVPALCNPDVDGFIERFDPRLAGK